MRIILKLLAAPFVLALTLLVAVLNFAFSFASWVFCALSFLCLIGALFALFTGDRWGIQGLVIAFAVSPFGLPAVAEWLIDKLDSLNYSLKSFITGYVDNLSEADLTSSNIKTVLSEKADELENSLSTAKMKLSCEVESVEVHNAGEEIVNN